MGNSNEGISSNQVPTLITIEVSTSQYKKTIKTLNTEMFNIHTIMMVVNKENAKLNYRNVELSKRNDYLEQMVLNFDALKEEIEYLKNTIVCAEKIKKILRTQISEIEFKIKAY